jgi:hypothetical protein
MSAGIKAKMQEKSPEEVKATNRYAATHAIDSLLPFVDKFDLLPDKTTDLIFAALNKALAQLADSL